MPAVQLQRLTDQTRELLWKFTQPEQFTLELRELLEYYGNRVYRAGQSVQQERKMVSYRVPNLVMLTLERELQAPCLENPGAALALADRLWLEKALEPRQLAAALLGMAPISEKQTVLARMQAWTAAGEDLSLLLVLVSKGSARLRHEDANSWLEVSIQWLERPETSQQAIGIHALTALLEDRSFTNLPPIYDAIMPLISDPPQALVLELQRLLALLLVCSPGETVYVIKQVLRSKPGVNTRKLVRAVLPRMAPADQEAVRALMTAN
ncbi:MAG: hypothetical protein HPY76_04205 [Anaerolineae bacterium]|jgi:hypothetical protein|nr:hypothetical protein [Anaerolineae bacterium]